MSQQSQTETNIAEPPKGEAEPSKEEQCSSYAYVMLCMRGDAYVPGVIAMAESIRMTKTQHDIVCMCTPDVTDDACELIATVARVVKIDYVQYNTKKMKTKRQMELYGSWLSQAYTKWRCLELTEYKKILFVDADMIVANNIDHLFDLQAPAGTFSTPWAREYAKESTFDLRGYPSEHGACVTAESIEKTFERTNGYTMIASMVLLEPNQKEFDELCSMIEHMQPFGLDNWSTPDEQSLTYYYGVEKKRNWTMIHQRYNSIVHKVDWLRDTKRGTCQVPHALHYFSSTKPWQDKDPIAKTVFNTSRIWWYVMRQWWLREQRDIPGADGKPLTCWEEMKTAEHIKLARTRIDDKFFPWLAAMRVPFPELF